MVDKQKVIITCPLCGSGQVQGIYQWNNAPVVQNYLFSSRKEAINVKRGDITIQYCLSCGFVFNSSYNPDILLYDGQYDNSQYHSSCFQFYTDTIIDHILSGLKGRNNTVLEIGSGNATFLQKLVDKGAGKVTKAVGYDPSFTGPDHDEMRNISYVKEYINEKTNLPDAQVIICRHVIEHISDPVTFLHSIKRSIPHGSKPCIFFETPDVDWILKNSVFWDFFYEHCSYFSYDTISYLFQKTGFTILNVTRNFQDQYLWIDSTSGEHIEKGILIQGVTKNLISEFITRNSQKIEDIRQKIKKSKETRKVALWGAAAKGVTLSNLIDPECSIIDCVIDLNPNKTGCYLPGTGHPVVSFQEAEKRGVQIAFIVNPNYYEECKRILLEHGIDIKLILI